MCGLVAAAIQEADGFLRRFPPWRAFHQTRKHRSAALHAKREEEKGTSPSGKVQLHTSTSRLFRLLS